MSDKNLLDPRFNELIPGGPLPDPPELSPDYAELHAPEPPELSPDYADLHPPEPPNDLCPGYVEHAKPETPDVDPPKDWIGDELARTKADPCGFDDGLQLRRPEFGNGLRVFKNGLIVRDLLNLDAENLRSIRRYLESARGNE